MFISCTSSTLYNSEPVVSNIEKNYHYFIIFEKICILIIKLFFSIHDINAMFNPFLKRRNFISSEMLTEEWSLI